MPVGIEKIVIVRSGRKSSPKTFTIQANEAVQVQAIYYPDTPEATKGNAKWIVKSKAGTPYTKSDQHGKIGDLRGVSVKPKFCGPKLQVIEAFIDHPTNTYPQQLSFRATAPQKIISATWSKTKGGSSIGNAPMKYGDDIWLHIDTEGLNGAYLDIDVYNPQWGDDGKVGTYTVPCIYGEVNLYIKNTYTWRSMTGNMRYDKEKFYIQVRLRGKKETLKDKGGKEKLAEHLIIENEVTTRQVEKHETARPLTIGENEVNVERYELCQFKKIAVTDDKKEIVLFEEGKLQLSNKKKSEFQVSETIHFDLDKHAIRADAKPVLDGIANLLLDNPYVPAELGAHCDIRASHEHNDPLSQRRAKAAVAYLTQKGVNPKVLSARGYGKRRLLVEGEHLSPEEHQMNRRVTIRFKIYQKDAQSIVFDTIAPDDSRKKKVSFTVGTYKTDSCLKKGTDLAHDNTQVKVIELTSNGKSKPYTYNGTKPIEHEVYSNLSRLKVVPLQYIWPHKNTTNDFEFYIHSCRYYSNKERPTVIVKAYPDIKWDFHFFLNLSDKLSVTWQKLGAAKHKEMQKEAAKIGANKRHKQVAVDFGVILEANWNKIDAKRYDSNFKVTAKFSDKIKKIYDVFAALKDVSKIITKETKGKVTTTRLGKSLPFSVVIEGPNLCLGAEWQCARGRLRGVDTKEIGTEVKFYLKAKPIIKLELVIDLLGLAINAGLAVATGGATANPGAAQLIAGIREWLADDDHPVSLKMYIDLKFFGEIKTPGIEFTYNTASDENKGEATLDTTVGIVLEAGVEIKAKITALVVEFYFNGVAKATGKGSITFGHQLKYVGSSSGKSLNYAPRLLFDGIKVTVVVKAEVGMAIKKGWINMDRKTSLKDYKGDFPIVREFDVIKKANKLMGTPLSVTLIK